MENQHSQESLVESFRYKGVAVDLVRWTDTVWCGKIAYASGNSGEPDVEKLAEAMGALQVPSEIESGREKAWEACISINYRSKERPNGVMFAYRMEAEIAAEGFDWYRVPAAQYMRVPMTAETAKSLGREPWGGGIPPYEWIGEGIAPELGYRYGSDTLPVIEYYSGYDPAKGEHEHAYLYVPVEKA